MFSKVHYRCFLIWLYRAAFYLVCKVLLEYPKHLWETERGVSHSCKLVFIEIQIFTNMNVQVVLLPRECLLLLKSCESCINNSNLVSYFTSFFFYFTLFLLQVFTWMVVFCFKRECLICASLMSDKRYQVGPTFLVSGINKIQIIMIQSNKEGKKTIQRVIFISQLKEKRKSIL